MRRLSILFAGIALAVSCLAVADLPPMPTLSMKVDLGRYAGQWYIHGCIPLRIPYFNDSDARNYTEKYELLSENSIRMTSAFETGEPHKPQRRSFSFDGDIVDTARNAIWKIWFLWPIGAKYSIVYLDESYTTTIVASSNRRYAWIMSREPYMSDSRFAELLSFMKKAGFDPEKFRKVPQDKATTAKL